MSGTAACELVGALWVLGVSVIAHRSGRLPTTLTFLGYFIAIAGILTVLPQLSVFQSVFGLAQIPWFGWIGMLMGVLSGAIIGLQFHKKDWLGGYAARPRRFVRLGHISFFGIGLMNLFYGLTLGKLGISDPAAMWGAYLFLGALISMPICCFLTAWKTPCRAMD